MHRSRILLSAALLIGTTMCIFVPPSTAQVKGQLPPGPKNAPQIGQKAPDFTLPDSNGTPVKLSSFSSIPTGGKPPWVLLIFYRGYW
ncbi:MAG: redoxin domain-containing protein [Acidobacteria bacterium]|nr:redoxin domain-containing protein [Acidobacteriota bacterium]